MIARHLILALCMLTGLGVLRAQYLHDSQYVMGYWSDTGFQDPILSFSNDSVLLRHEQLAFGFIECNQSMSDARGKLQFYFNGCDLATADHQIMENGTGFNPGRSAKEDCPARNGYAASHQSTISLTFPGSNNKFIIFHDRVNIKSGKDSFQIYSDLNYSMVDMSVNQGKGKVITKNIHALRDTFLSGGGLCAVRHQNGEDWWVIKQDYRYTNNYYKILVTKDGPKEHSSQRVGDTWSRSPLSAGFSADGTKYYSYTSNYGVSIMDFDRSDGRFYNYRQIRTVQEALFSGASFSPNGRFIYIGSGPHLYQVDLEEEELRLDTVAVWDGSVGNVFGQPNWFGAMQTGIDCRIYVLTGYCLPFMHIIMYPDEKGKACEVRQHALEFDTPVCNIPYFPNYRLDTPYDYCNPNITVLTPTQEVIDLLTTDKERMTV